MERALSEVLDECLTLLEEGEADLQACLDRFPEQAAALHPLLEISDQLLQLRDQLPTPTAYPLGKERMLNALEDKKRHSWAGWDLSWWRALLSLRASRAVLIASAAAVILLVGGLLTAALLPRTVGQMALVQEIDGVGEVRLVGQDAWQRLQVGDRVGAGVGVRTGPDDKLTLTFFEGSMVGLGAGTELVLSEVLSERDGSGRIILIDQLAGRTLCVVEPLSGGAGQFEVRTPSAAVSVRGTEFSVALREDGTTDVAVTEGVVEVAAQGEVVTVSAGRGVSVLPGEPPCESQPPVPQETDLTEPPVEQTAGPSLPQGSPERPRLWYRPARDEATGEPGEPADMPEDARPQIPQDSEDTDLEPTASPEQPEQSDQPDRTRCREHPVQPGRWIGPDCP
jgi:hypothetical protein